MVDFFKIDNNVNITDADEIESDFVRIFGRIPDSTIRWPKLEKEKYPHITNFVEKSSDFFAENAKNTSTRLYDHVYESRIETSVRLYTENAMMVVSTTKTAKGKLGITVKNFHRIIENGSRVEISFSNDSKFAKEVYQPLFRTFTPIESTEKSQAYFNIIEDDGRGNMYLNDIEVKIEDNNFDISSMYNNDFPSVHERIMKSLVNEQTGLILLHGGVGTGKTSYIRRLIKELSQQEKRVIYMPPNMANSISSPSFMPFLIEHKNSVIVIEDAENILRTREANENSSVANILNATDGLMGDALKLQFICTFNAEKTEIDPALFRKGRLLQEYEFGNLEIEKARKLWEDVGNPVEEFPETDLPISDIFNYGDRIEMEEEDKVSFGFTPKK